MKVRLSTLREYLAEQHVALLVENRVDDARDKYPDMEDENFDFLVANQPAGSNNKYLMWCCKQADELLANDPDPQGLRIVTQAVRLFDANKQRLQKKDLNQYKDPAEVEAVVDELGGASKNQQSKQAKSDTDVIYNDDHFIVLRPHTTEASCKYGVGTKWCIAATASRNYFHSYSSSNNKFYFVIDKTAEANTPTSKFAIVINEQPTDENHSRIQVFNAPDHQVGLAAVIRHCGSSWPAIWDKIRGHVKTSPHTREVEEAQKATEEHVKTMLKGEQVSGAGLAKIAQDAALTTPVVLALIKQLQGQPANAQGREAIHTVMSRISERAAQLTPEGALAVIKYLPTTKPENEQYWSGNYQMEALIKNAPLTAEAFKELAKSNNDKTIALILRNPNCPQEILESLSARLPDIKDRELKKNIWRALIRKGTITPEQMREAMTSGRSAYDSLAYEVVNYPELTAKLSPELLRLVPISSAHDLKKFLDLPNIPPDLAADLISTHWKELKKDERYELLRKVALPTTEIERIWQGKDQHVRVALLQNPSIGAENAAKFAASRNSAYRFAVAHNPITPVASLQTLAGDESASTRSGVASNPNTPPETLKILGGDEATAVRASVGSNSKSPRSVLDALKKDSDEFVRKSARKTLKSLEQTETFIRMNIGMMSLLTEEMTDDDEQDIMTPHWSELPVRQVPADVFVAIYLLQNNGHASREEIEEAFQSWNPQTETTRHPNRYRRGYYGRRPITVKAKNVWQIIKSDEAYDSSPARTTSPTGKGWWWALAGINKGSVYRLTPTGASIAMETLANIRQTRPNHPWTAKAAPAVKKSPPPRELAPRDVNAVDAAVDGTQAPRPAATAGAPRGPKTTYKVYGKFKGHPAATRLKGQAYVAADGTQFRGGEQAYITPTDDGKLSVKKTDSDHTQTWDPIDG